MRTRILLLFFGLYFLIQNNLCQSTFKLSVDASAEKLPYDEYTISALSQKLESNMLQDFGWQDNVTWIKGIVHNIQLGAIDGKCGTKKGQIFYFRTVIKDIDGDVHWDFDSFSKEVLNNIEISKAKKQNRLKSYQDKLNNLRDSLSSFYANKYVSQYKIYTSKCDSLVKAYNEYFGGSQVDMFRMECQPYEYKDDLENISEVFSSIMLDYEEFLNSSTPEIYFKESIENALVEIQHIDNSVNNSFAEKNKRYESLKKRVEQEIKSEINTKEEDNKKKEQISQLENSMTNKIVSVSKFISNKRNKKLALELFETGNDEQKSFYSNYLSMYDTEQLIKEYKLYIYMAANDDYKLERLKKWDSNLDYWGKYIK